LRLSAHGHRAGLVSAEELGEVVERRRAIDAELTRLKGLPLAAQIRRPEVRYAALAARDPLWPAVPTDVAEEVEVELKYEGYIAQQDRSLARATETWDCWKIPDNLSFRSIPGLPREAIEKLERTQPRNIAAARAIPGVTGAAIDLLSIHLRRFNAGQS
jgi:tRNA uridine 5-carboxymethylaminomethyl modification enzyme